MQACEWDIQQLHVGVALCYYNVNGVESVVELVNNWFKKNKACLWVVIFFKSVDGSQILLPLSDGTPKSHLFNNYF